MKQVAIGIDIGGTNTALGVVDEDGNVFLRLLRVRTKKKPYKSLNL
jgi:predicted NBD/HSP70 family sugar kinase